MYFLYRKLKEKEIISIQMDNFICYIHNDLFLQIGIYISESVELLRNVFRKLNYNWLRATVSGNQVKIQLLSFQNRMSESKALVIKIIAYFRPE